MKRLLAALLLATAAAALLVAPASAYKIEDKPMPDALQGTSYTYQFGAVGGSAPHKFVIQSGALPPGLSMSDEGAVSGSPTTNGTWTMWVQARDSFGLTSERFFSLTVTPRLMVSTPSLPSGTLGAAYSTKLSVVGGVAKTWSVSLGSLPPGLKLGNDGVISGTPSSQGTWTFTVLASDGSKSDTKQFTISIVQPVAIGSGSLPPAVVGVPFATQLAASGGVGAYQYRLLSGSLPTGLTFDGASGVIAGVPRAAGSYVVTIGATASGGGAAEWKLHLIVKSPLGFSASTLPRAKVGRAYSGRVVVRGGVGTVTLSSTSLFPPGIRLNGDTGTLSGRPLKAGTYHVQVTARDSFGGAVSKRLTITVGR